MRHSHCAPLFAAAALCLSLSACPMTGTYGMDPPGVDAGQWPYSFPDAGGWPGKPDTGWTWPKPSDAGSTWPQGSDAGLGWVDERLLPDEWEKPVALPTPINQNGGWTDQAWIAPDGTRLYFLYYDCAGAGPARPGAIGFFDVYETRLIFEPVWSVPTGLSANVNTALNESAAVESYDGQTLVFATQDPAALPALRRVIRFAHRQIDGSWGKPLDPGPVINPPGMQQDTPSLTADGRTMFFMRSPVQPAGADGDAQMHVFWSTRSDPGCDTCWSTPVQLPPPVTGNDREIQPHIRPNGKTLYFTARRDGKPILAVTHQSDWGGGWSTPTLLEDLQDDPLALGEGGASLTADGMTLYFARAYPTGVSSTDPCKAVTFKLFKARRKL